MKCKNIKRDISAYIDGELNEREESNMQFHLKFCAKCRRIFDNFTMQRELLNKIEEIEPSPDFDAKLWGKIRETGSDMGLRESLWFPAFLRRMPAVIMASLILFLGISGGILSFLAKQGSFRQSDFKNEPSTEMPVSFGLRAFRDVPPNSIEEAYLKLSDIRGSG